MDFTIFVISFGRESENYCRFEFYGINSASWKIKRIVNWVRGARKRVRNLFCPVLYSSELKQGVRIETVPLKSIF